MQADATVIATDGCDAQRLTGSSLSVRPVGITCLYFASERRLYAGARILYNGDAGGSVAYAVQISNVAPGYAPAGQHLLAVTVLVISDLGDEALVDRCRTELAPWFPGAHLDDLRHLATYRIPFAQFKQPPGIFSSMPANTTATRGLFVAGEYTESSTIHGAMHSGEKAAQAVLAFLRTEQ